MLLKRRIVLYVSLVCVCFPSALFAAPKDELEQTKQELEQSRKHQAELSEQNKKVESDLDELQKKLVQLASDVQKSESQLTGTEDKLRILNEQLKVKSDALAAQKKHLAALVQTSLRLSSTPPEAIVMMPGDTSETIKAARALQMATSGIKEEVQSIRGQMAELKKLQQKVADRHSEMVKQQNGLNKVRQGLKAKMAERKALQDKLGQQQQQEDGKIAQLAKKAEDLQGLLSSLEREERDQRGHWRGNEPDNYTTQDKAQKGKIRSFKNAKGHIRPPLMGKLVQKFGESHAHEAASKGITLLTRDDAQAVAPFDGEVVFTGPFLNYGKLVIIRHSDDFHTLLAGLKKIDVKNGEFLLEGEPIGAMGDKDSQNRLYLELRKNNQPIDPRPWISGLAEKP